VVITVSDDGGLDADAIVARAREHGIFGGTDVEAPEQAPSLIFTPGLSTAATVTEISGRGVGMDAVKTAVDNLRGTIVVTSSRGQGTTVTLTLPLTLALIDGMVVRVGAERYIVPALSVVRIVSLDPSRVSLVLGRGEALDTREGIVPLLRLRELLAPGTDEPGDHTRLGLIVTDGSAMAGLVVDELIGHQQIVIKSLGAGLGRVDGIAGASILPDGRVGLIIDVHALVRTTHSAQRQGER